jgi:hypothetical protein
MHILLPICGKFTRARIAHQIFLIKIRMNGGERNMKMCTPCFAYREMSVRVLTFFECAPNTIFYLRFSSVFYDVSFVYFQSSVIINIKKI